MKWVVDASVAVRWFLKNEADRNADAVLRAILDRPEYFAVPELFAFEVYAVLSRMLPEGGRIFVKGMVPILNCGIFRQPMTESLASTAKRFVGKGLTGYDACYAALAYEIKGTWLTYDEKAHKCLAKQKVSHLLSKNLPKTLVK